jgi:hypothetical protein
MKQYQIKLIDNTYSMEDARELLLALINDKIKFLNLKTLSLQERFGADTSKYEQRIAELREEKNQLLIKLKNIEKSHDLVEVDCHVHLKIHDSEHVVV